MTEVYFSPTAHRRAVSPAWVSVSVLGSHPGTQVLTSCSIFQGIVLPIVRAGSPGSLARNVPHSCSGLMIGGKGR